VEGNVDGGGDDELVNPTEGIRPDLTPEGAPDAFVSSMPYVGKSQPTSLSGDFPIFLPKLGELELAKQWVQEVPRQEHTRPQFLRKPMHMKTRRPVLELAELRGRSHEVCVPWLAELRSWDLHQFTGGKGAVTDMKTTREQCFKARAGGSSRLSNYSFLGSLGKWYHGPSRDEAARLFAVLDTSGDGSLDYEEYNWENLCGFRGLLLTVLGAQKLPFTQGFHILDKNRDGELKEDEFMAESTGELLGLHASAARDIFKILDVNTSEGSITRSEFEHLGGLPRLRLQIEKKEPDVANAFQEADKNNDRNLQKAEFLAHAQVMGDFRNLKAASSVMRDLDKNHDGVLARSEYVNTCWKSTGAICNGLDAFCDQWRGPVFCGRDGALQMNRPCMCAPGYCAKNGACIPEELHASSDQPLGPEAGKVLAKMQTISVNSLQREYLGGRSDVNPAETIVSLLFVLAILMQLKSAFTSFPALAVLSFAASIISFTLVATVFFRAYSVPYSMKNDAQLLVALLIYCSIAYCVTSLTRLWSPAAAKTPIICWFTNDDADEFGLDIAEERIVWMFNCLSQVVMAVCTLGLWEGPLDAQESSRTRFMLLLLYAFIVVLDSQLLVIELSNCAARKLKCELHLHQRTVGPRSSTIHTRLISLAAWWNDFCTDAELEGRDVLEKGQLPRKPSAFKRFNTFEVFRTWPDPPKRQPRLKSMPTELCNELFSLNSTVAQSVYGKVVVIWEDANLEMESVTSAVPRLKLIEDAEDMTSQTLQEKMWMVTQAGASGLVIGQRLAGALNAEKFGTSPQHPKPEFVWSGSYKVKDGNADSLQKSAPDFEKDWMTMNFLFGGTKASRTAMGCAVNTFLIGFTDMQELEWALSERSQDARSIDDIAKAKDGRDDALHPSQVICASFAQRRRAAGETGSGNSSPLAHFSLRAQARETDGKHFAKLLGLQRQLLSDVSPTAKGPLDFLSGVRSWVEQLPFVKHWSWAYIHLLMTACALFFVLEMGMLMYRRMHVNKAGLWAYFFVLFVAVLNGCNISVRIDWWVFKPALPQKVSVGAVLAGIIMIVYSSAVVGLFVYYVARKFSGE
jgi:Ca2+-binding EF-hand superfamily protein